jgi:SSS family solute:Na+ symporter
MLITFGAIALFFVVIIAILHLSGIKDRNFSEYAVGGRSFGPYYQAMSFLNSLRRHGRERRRDLVLRPLL